MINGLNLFASDQWVFVAQMLICVTLFAVLTLYRRERNVRVYDHQQLTHSHQQLLRQLRSSVTDTRAMLDQASLIVMVFDRDAITLRFANRQALELFGCATLSELSDTVLMRPDAWQPEPFTLLEFEHWLIRARSSGAEVREWLFNDGGGNGVWVEGTIGNTVFEGRSAQILTATNIHSFKLTRAADRLRARSLVGINNDLPLEQVLESLSKLISIRCKGATGHFSLYDEQRALLINMGSSSFATKFKQLMPSVPAVYAATSIGTAAHTRERVVCESVSEDHRWQGYTHLPGKLNFSSTWSEPIIGQNGKLLGVFTVFSDVPQAPDKEHIETLSSIVSMAGLAIERKTWRESLESAASSEKFIRKLGVDIVNLPAGPNFASRLNQVLENVLHQYELGTVTLWGQAEQGEDLVMIGRAGHEGAKPQSGSSSGQGEPKYVESAIILESIDDQAYKYLMPDDSGYQTLSSTTEPKPVLMLPLYADAHKSQLIGSLTIESQFFYVPHVIIDHLVVIGSIFRTALLNHRLMETLSHTAEAEKKERHKLESELSVARSIQMSMVPGAGKFSECYKDWTIEAWLQPAKAVGGDLYEFIRLPSGRVLVAVGDVSDKGAPAALFMARTVSLLNYLARNKDGDLKSITVALNDELCRANEACMFVTLLLASLDLGTGEIQWVNAGHNEPMRISQSSDAVFWSGKSGPPLGLYEDVTYDMNRARIFPEETLVIYSDGVTEAFNVAGEEFGDDRLLQVGNRANVASCSSLVLLREALTRFTGPLVKQSDDITIMAIRHHGSVL